MSYGIVLALAAGAFLFVAVAHADEEPWQAADMIRSALSKIERIVYRDPDEANRSTANALLRDAEALYHSALAVPIGQVDQAQRERIDAAFTALSKAIDVWSVADATRARATIQTGILAGAYRQVVAAFDAGELQRAKAWLSIREYAPATRDTAATGAMDAALAGTLDRASARRIVEGELLHTYASELRRSLSGARDVASKGYATQLAGLSERAQGLALLLMPSLIERLGAPKARDLEQRLSRLAGHEKTGDALEAVDGAEQILQGYSPVTLTTEERERRARLLIRFLKLVYIEYKDGVRDGRISVRVEYEEARLFLSRAQMLLGDLGAEMIAAAPDDFAKVQASIAGMHQIIEAKGSPSRVKMLSEEATATVTRVFGISAESSGHKVALDMLPTILDEIVLLAGHGDYPGAELKRQEAYAFFDPDIEQHLMPRSPALSLKLESAFWEGSAMSPGLAKLIADGVPPARLEPAVAEMKTLLDHAQSLLETKLTPVGAFLQSLAIMLREGLEAVIVIAALIGALKAAGSTDYGRYIWGGVAIGVATSLVLWFVADRLISISTANRELLEGVTALLAAAVLIYVTHWIFHKAYASDWMEYVKGQAREAVSVGRLAGIGLLSFSVVFREGFETVLFYEAMMIDASPMPVLGGFLVGLAGTAASAYAVLRLGLRLPLGLFFKATGFLLAILVLVFVGAGIRGLQTADLVSATPVPGIPDSTFLQLYLGIFPVAEPLLAQLAVLALFLTGWIWLRMRSGHASRESHPPGRHMTQTEA